MVTPNLATYARGRANQTYLRSTIKIDICQISGPVKTFLRAKLKSVRPAQVLNQCTVGRLLEIHP